MAIISRSYGYLFVMVPRTGCTSVAEGVLVPELEGSYLPAADLLDDDGNVLVARKHSTVGDLTGHGVLDVEEARSLFKFCTVRNPFDSLVSLYTKLRGQYVPLLDDPGAFIHDQPEMVRDIRFAVDHTFPEWIEHRYGRHRGDPRSFYGSYIRNVNHIMRFERLQADFDEVCTHLGAPRIAIPRINRVREEGDTYQRHYTPRARRTIEDVFAPDLDRFGYSFRPSGGAGAPTC